MNSTDLLYATLAGWPPRQPQPNIAPNNAAIEDSDYCGEITYSSTQVSAIRDFVFAGYEYANPNWRRRWRLPAVSEAILHLDNLGLVTGSYNGVIAILVDGSLFREVTLPNAVGRKYIRLGFSTAAQRDVEVVMPYSAAIADAGITVAGSILPPSTSRLSLPRLFVLGDSRPQGFSGTGVAKSWPHLLGELKGWQVLNHGDGSAGVSPALGTEAGEHNADVVLSLVDYNNRSAQTPLATFKQAYKDLINNFRAIKPTTKFYLIQSTWISAANDALTLKMADYRTAEAEALTELADANNILINGLALTTNSTASQPDGIHQNDAGHQEMATALAALVSI